MRGEEMGIEMVARSRRARAHDAFEIPLQLAFISTTTIGLRVLCNFAQGKI